MVTVRGGIVILNKLLKEKNYPDIFTLNTDFKVTPENWEEYRKEKVSPGGILKISLLLFP